MFNTPMCTQGYYFIHIRRVVRNINLGLLAGYPASLGFPVIMHPFHAIYTCTHFITVTLAVTLNVSNPNINRTTNPTIFVSYDTVLYLYPYSLGSFDKMMSIEHATWCHFVQKTDRLFNTYRSNIKIPARPWPSSSGYTTPQQFV